MHIRSTALVATALIAGALLTGCGSDKSVDTSGVITISPNKLTVCSDIPYAPFEIDEAGNYSGIDVDLMNAIGSDLNYSVTFQKTTFDDIFDAMNDKKCDMVVSALSINDERKKIALFSDGYFEVNQSLLVRSSDEKTYGSLDALQGHKIGVQSSSTGEEYAKGHFQNSSMLMDYDSSGEMIAALKAKAIDGVVQDYPINSYAAQKDTTIHVVQTFTDVQREEYGFAMPKDSTKLQAAVNASLKNIRKDGRYDDILGKYLGTATSRK
jgi:polar amino acid transport system substrate-binding protein